MSPATNGAPYSVPPEPSRLPAFLLAVAVHAVLVGFLWFGISWQNNEPVAVEAEVWDMSVQTAAAPELPPPPAPEPEPTPEPTPAPQPAPPPPRVAEPPPIERPAPTPPDINLQREKQLKEEARKRELAEQREQKRKEDERKELAEQKKKDEAERKEKELAKKEADDKKKLEQQAAEKKLALEKAAKDKAAKDKAAKDKAAKADEARLAQIRADDLKRMAGAMGSSGSAVKSTAPKADAGYVAAITAKIKSNTAYAGSTTMPGNPKAVFKVEQLPTGAIMSVRLVKSSGVPEFDRAVENGIKASTPLPTKKDGTVERTLDVNFSMKDYD